jgi:hypothetical protein
MKKKQEEEEKELEKYNEKQRKIIDEIKKNQQ